MPVLYGVEQIRVTPLLDSGAPDASASPVTCDDIQSLDINAIYIDGNESVLRGGDSIKAVVKEEDTFSGVDLTMTVATLDYELKEAIVGGQGASNSWEAPVNITENPYPFKLEVWVKNYSESDSESIQDGYIKYTFNFCKGRLGSQNPSDQNFAVEQYIIRARRNDSNPSDIEPAIEMEKVSAIS